MGGVREYGSVLLGCTKYGEFLYYLRNRQLLKTGSAPWI
jgi:hypothetical protein